MTPKIEQHLYQAVLTGLLCARAPVIFAYNGGIGDRLCNLPALRALAALFPGRLVLVCGKGDSNLYYSDLNLRAIHEIDLELIDTGFEFDAKDLARKIADCDLFISINPWHTSSVSKLLAMFPHTQSIGFFPDFRYQVACDYVGHAMDMAFAVPSFLNSALKINDYSEAPSISGVAMTIAEGFKRRSSGWRRTLFVHTDTKPEKRWPYDRFQRVLENFLHEFPDVGVLLVDIGGEWLLRLGQFSERILPVILPLDVCFALLRASDLFLGIDSCHLHAADLFRVPGVGIFGPTTSRRWGYKFSNHKHVQGSGRMADIEVETVYVALSDLAHDRFRD